MVDFTGMTKHVGVLSNTGKNVVVVYMTLPGDENNALVVDVDALPDTFNDSLRRIVESEEGQQIQNLGDLLGRRPSPDGSQSTLLQKFHTSGRLQKVPVDLITMTPKKGIRWPLRDILKAMKDQKEELPDGWDDLDPETKAQVASSIKKFNVHATNLEGEQATANAGQAQGLLRQAELLESEAQNLRMKAIAMDPRLGKPQETAAKRGRKPKAETQTPTDTAQ